MGCAQSKIDSEGTVSRCRDRKQFIKEAVSARNAFAAAHSAYVASLKNTGAALNEYAHREVQVSSATSSLPQPSYDSLLPPPPPPPNPSPSILQRASSAPEFSVSKTEIKLPDPIIEEEDEEDEIDNGSLRRRSRKGSGGGSISGISRRGLERDEHLPPPPPSPPMTPPKNVRPPTSPLPESNGMGWDFFGLSMENLPGPSLMEMGERKVEEEIEQKIFDGRSEGSDADGDRKRSLKVEAGVVEKPEDSLVEHAPTTAAKTGKRVKQVSQTEGKRKGASSVSLLQIFTELDDCFLKASESAHEVSKMREANRLHYHSNFAETRGIKNVAVGV